MVPASSAATRRWISAAQAASASGSGGAVQACQEFSGDLSLGLRVEPKCIGQHCVSGLHHASMIRRASPPNKRLQRTPMEEPISATGEPTGQAIEAWHHWVTMGQKF
ncbi:hypothetical protein LIP_3381 [Limnochorda pilosa]|uniref:Uncharacterized protein n=1 Tax=Limnochorda pilosa TaxID=1555112 RepID=A0A0K2SPZ9_LIMPI|nr:hypothetical protein LIP_3381 [Limnochorda pilosa]